MRNSRLLAVLSVYFGLYAKAVGDSQLRLPLIIDGQPSTISHLELGPVKLGHPELEMLVQNPSPEYLRDDQLGEIIQLIGYDINSADASDVHQVTLFWQSLNPTRQQLTRFAHIRDNQNNLVAQHDAPPGGAAYPTSLWSSGDVIADHLTVALPSGVEVHTHRLVVGLYDAMTGERVPVVGRPDSEIEVKIAGNPVAAPTGVTE